VSIRDEFVCTLADGRRLAVLHGDQFDPIERNAEWLSNWSCAGYDHMLSVNWWMSRFLTAADGNPYRLCCRLKNLVKQSIYFMQKFEDRVFDYARLRGLDGVICGHLHTPRILERDGLTYCNAGDWIENCAAVVEEFDGRLEVIRYYDSPQSGECEPERTTRTGLRTPHSAWTSPRAELLPA
jgi:UDP-2,3-diacylglucosamine pyrophosphatase LpxH